MCIGWEALLGDDSANVSLTETLADRCAYLLGKDIKGRRKIKKHFKELYKIRSKVIHGVTQHLSEEEKYKFLWGKDLLDFAIKKELKK